VSDESLVQLGAELRRIREDVGFTGSEVARAVGWSQPKYSRVETGRFGASPGEMATLLDYYGVPEEVRAELLSRVARREGLEGAWVVRAGGSRRRQAELSTIESRVTGMQQYHASIVPGLLQTPPYARALASALGYREAAEIARRRTVRQNAFQSGEGVSYEVVLDARALLRWPGDDKVMIDQVERLLSPGPGRLNLRILPLGGRARALAIASFLVYDFTEDRPSVVLSEAQQADLYLSAPDQVTAYKELFAKLQKDALSPRASRAHLERTLRDLRSGTQREGK
jgi:transcriptional regulator with XRE-family HTH domain